jgi:ABC-type uncharacterized transport system ATPase component
MVFSNNGTGKRPALSIIKPNIETEQVKVQIKTPTMNSYTVLNKYGMIQRVLSTSNCKSCDK